VVVPDVFGSSLADPDGATAWPDVAALAGIGAIAALDVEAHRDAQALTPVYDRLVDALSGRLAVHPFPYDWRRPFEAVAEDLVKAVEEVAAQRTAAGPVHVVTHGAG